MATPLGTSLDKNPFKTAMDSSIPNASDISQQVKDNLEAGSVTDARIIPLFDYFKTRNVVFQPKAASQKADLDARKTATKQVVITVKGMKVELRSWVRQITNVFPEGSEEYDRLLIGGSTPFYNGSRALRFIRVNALITAIGDITALATLKAQIQDYADALSGKKTIQTVKKKNVKIDTVEINVLKDNCTSALWYVYLGLLMLFIDTPAAALAFLPMDLIYKAANQKIYTLLVPSASLRKICIHLFKEGEMVQMTNNRSVDLKIGLALNAKATVLIWYTLRAGQTVTINPRLLGDVAMKYVMTENEDIDITGDITFIINAA